MLSAALHSALLTDREEGRGKREGHGEQGASTQSSQSAFCNHEQCYAVRRSGGTATPKRGQAAHMPCKNAWPIGG